MDLAYVVNCRAWRGGFGAKTTELPTIAKQAISNIGLDGILYFAWPTRSRRRQIANTHHSVEETITSGVYFIELGKFKFLPRAPYKHCILRHCSVRRVYCA